MIFKKIERLETAGLVLLGSLALLPSVVLVDSALAHDPVLGESALDKELALHGPQVQLLVQRAQARAAQGDLQGALKGFSEALQLDPHAHEIWGVRGRVLADFGSMRAAQVDLSRYLEWHPTDASTQWRLGQVEVALSGLKGNFFGTPRWGGAHHPRAQVEDSPCDYAPRSVHVLNENHTEIHGDQTFTVDRARLIQAAERFEETLPNLNEPRPYHYLELAAVLAALGEPLACLQCINAGLWDLSYSVALLEGGARLASEFAMPGLAAAYLQEVIQFLPRSEPWVEQQSTLLIQSGKPLRPLVVQPPKRFASTNQFVSPAPPNLVSSGSGFSGVDSVALHPEAVFIEKGGGWQYLDDGSDQGTAWRDLSFAATGWSFGRAELGYGDGDEHTVVSAGPDPSNKYITTYLRNVFTVPVGLEIDAPRLEILRDDGVVAYLNGVEVYRSNMPQGAVGFQTLASQAIGGFQEHLFHQSLLDASLFQAGDNVLAVELHQSSGGSSDISFDCRLVASRYLGVTRGPYLQSGKPDGGMLRWRTSEPVNSVVWIGPNPHALTVAFQDGIPKLEHEVSLQGLQPATRYYYAVGNSSRRLAGGDSNAFFETHPLSSSTEPVRIWAIGDSGTANVNARAVYDAYRNFAGTTHTDVWLMLGDNAYRTGTDAEYQEAVFEMYPELLQQAFLWPTLGNHDGVSAGSSAGAGVYYDIFTMPRQGEAGGLPSGTEAYYSFDYGPVHFICLDSEDSSLSTSGPMLSWLSADLAAHDRDWTIAFWHHPPYSKGSHDSDLDLRLTEVRENVLPTLEAGGVDLVLCGHSHSYERSFLLDGHYGVSSTLLPSMLVDAGNGGTDGAYEKATVGSAGHEGVVYSVAGSSGRVGGGSYDHPAMYLSMATLGSVVIDVSGNTVTVRFLSSTGAVLDTYSIEKG